MTLRLAVFLNVLDKRSYRPLLSFGRSRDGLRQTAGKRNNPNLGFARNSIGTSRALEIVESGTVEDVFYDPRHPYTWGLLSAMPDLGTDDERLYTIPGSPPNLLHKVTGDAFAPRNKYALNIDSRLEPPMFKISETHSAATWLLHPKAPKVDMPPELRDRIERMKKEGGIA